MTSGGLAHDFLKEVFNISVGKAAKMLSEITDKKIILNVPELVIVNEGDDYEQIKNYLSIMPAGALLLSSISFDRNLKGRANLIFPAAKMRTFINLCMNVGNVESDDFGDADSSEKINFTDMDLDIIKEVGNIILNSIVGGIGNILDIDFEYTLPEVRLYAGENFMNDNDDFPCVLMLYISFIIGDTEIEGAIVINLTLNSLNELISKVKKKEDDLYRWPDI